MRRVSDWMTPDPVVVGPTDPVATAARQLRALRARHLLVVTADGRLAGLVTDAAVFERGRLQDGRWLPAEGQPEDLHVSRIAQPVDTLRPDDTLASALAALLVSPDDALAVVDRDGVPVGIATITDALRLASRELPAGESVGTAATPLPLTVRSDTSQSDAWALCRDHGIRHLPVVDDGRLVGVVSVRDLIEAGAAVGGYGPVGDIASPPTETTGPDDALRDAADRMARQKVGCLLVLDEDGALTGLLSAKDVLRALEEWLRA